MMGDKPRYPKEPREPLQCWGCGGDHMLRNCLHQNGNVIQAHNIQGAETMGQVVTTIPRIYAALEDRQEDHQSTVVEFEGKIAQQFVSILIINTGSTHSYIKPKIVEICDFKKLKHNESWLVKIATENKRKVSEII